MEDSKIKVGDMVDVYIPVGELPYEHETRKVIGIDILEGLAHLDDNSSVGIGYCTKMEQPDSKIKALFFAQYLGQGFEYDFNDVVKKVEILGGIMPEKVVIYSIGHFQIINVERCVLLLRTTEQLTDEEKEIIAHRMQIYPEDVLDWINGDCGHDDYENLGTWLPCYDILKAFGILLPFTYLNSENKPITLSPDELITRGWAKIKTI